ncbi:RelA [Bifidobacterium animalis subsp. lactis AD011]|uniref:RelA n=1 Tax=Bifidobacterium animalis subsp. lactis (strain AD011) TaxID=442563 RepID=B8DTC0_BIFA0|nr:RelA [Bifidobacterium animalis subsp. lactis AD011]
MHPNGGCLPRGRPPPLGCRWVESVDDLDALDHDRLERAILRIRGHTVNGGDHSAGGLIGDLAEDRMVAVSLGVQFFITTVRTPPLNRHTLLSAVRKIDGVFDVYRITGAKDSSEPRMRRMRGPLP